MEKNASTQTPRAAISQYQSHSTVFDIKIEQFLAGKFASIQSIIIIRQSLQSTRELGNPSNFSIPLIFISFQSTKYLGTVTGLPRYLYLLLFSLSSHLSFVVLYSLFHIPFCWYLFFMVYSLVFTINSFPFVSLWNEISASILS